MSIVAHSTTAMTVMETTYVEMLIHVRMMPTTTLTVIICAVVRMSVLVMMKTTQIQMTFAVTLILAQATLLTISTVTQSAVILTPALKIEKMIMTATKSAHQMMCVATCTWPSMMKIVTKSVKMSIRVRSMPATTLMEINCAAMWTHVILMLKMMPTRTVFVKFSICAITILKMTKILTNFAQILTLAQATFSTILIQICSAAASIHVLTIFSTTATQTTSVIRNH